MPQLTQTQVDYRDQMLQDFARRAGPSSGVCPCCHRPYQTGAERLAAWLNDPEKVRVFNAMAAAFAPEPK